MEALKRDRDQLWAEAAQREAEGESIRLNQGLWAAAAEAQADRFVDDPYVDALQDALCEMEGKISGATVWTILDIRIGTAGQEHNRRMGDAMRRLGWTRTKIRIDGKVSMGYVKGTQPWRQIIASRHYGSLRVGYAGDHAQDGVDVPF